MGAKKKQKLKALLFDFGGTLAFLDFELLAREFSHDGRKLDALALEHAEYAGRAAIDRHLMSKGNSQATAAAYELFFRREFEADQPDAVAMLISNLGLSAEEYREYLKGEGALAYRRAQEEAEADNVFGVPLFIFEREPFWGHDRIPILEQRLSEAGLAIQS